MKQLSDFLDELISELKTNYNQLGLKASGRWEKELEQKVEVTSAGYKGSILGMDYTYWLENGRGKTSEGKKGRLYGLILKWVEQKGIQVENKKSFAYLVARKIDREGIKVPNQFNAGGLVSNVITDQKILGFTKRLSTYFLESARSEVLKAWQLQG